MVPLTERLSKQGSGAVPLLGLIQRLAVLALILLTLRWAFGYVRTADAPQLVVMLVALGAGVGGAWLLFWIANEFILSIPNRRLRERLQPFVFVGPALLLLAVFLIYPAIKTIQLSLYDARSEAFVGLENYRFAFTAPDMIVAFRNNLLWMVLTPTVCVTLGLVIAVLVDRVRFEALAKAFIFLPVAISTVGASVIWRFMYAFQPAGREQIGLLNAIIVALGGAPSGWITRVPWNNFALIVILIWLQTGFCMVVFSAAIKNVPAELMEAARIDGANEFQIFFRITVPYLRGTIITVSTTLVIMVLKIFDIVYVMTRGNYDTEVIANRMYVEMFTFRNFGHGSALAVVLFLAVVPVMIVNVRNLRRQRSVA